MKFVSRLWLAALSCMLSTGLWSKADAQSTACYFVGTVTSISASSYGPNSDLVIAYLHGLGSDGSTDHNFRIADFGFGPTATSAKIELVVTAFQHKTPLKITYYHNPAETTDVVHVIDVSRSLSLRPPPCGPG